MPTMEENTGYKESSTPKPSYTTPTGSPTAGAGVVPGASTPPSSNWFSQDISPLQDQAARWVAQGNLIEKFPQYPQLSYDQIQYAKRQGGPVGMNLATAGRAASSMMANPAETIGTIATNMLNPKRLAEIYAPGLGGGQVVFNPDFKVPYQQTPHMPPFQPAGGDKLLDYMQSPIVAQGQAAPPAGGAPGPTGAMSREGATNTQQGGSVGQQLGGALNFLQKYPDTFGGKLAGLAGVIMDIIGSGKRAYAGVDSPTRLQREYQMRLASQQQANQIYASMDAEIKKMDPQAQKDIRVAMAQGDIDKAVQIAVLQANFPLQKQLEMLKNQILYTNAQSTLPALGGPEEEGMAAITGTKAGQ
jgi:hypothetical protein